MGGATATRRTGRRMAGAAALAAALCLASGAALAQGSIKVRLPDLSGLSKAEAKAMLQELARVNVITSNWMQERFRPVHAIDVGMALETMLHDDTTAAETFELYGPTEYTMAELNDLVEREAMKKRRHVNVPKAIMKPVARYANKLLWWPIHSEDEVEREFIDQYIDPSAKTFKDLDIEPVELSSLTFEYLKGYRSSSYYDLPPMSEREKREEKKYLHVIDDQ